MNVLITGGAGYIGSHCNKLFNQQGIHTIVVDNLLFGHREAVSKGEFIAGDFGDRALLKTLCEFRKIDAVIHCAALADVADSVRHPDKYYLNNVSKMLTLLDVMVEHAVRYFVFSSSAAVFGEPQYLPIDEGHVTQPINPYGQTKLIGEKILQDYEQAYGIQYIALRYFNAAGADPEGEIGESHHPEHHLLPLVLQTGLGQREKLLVYGDNYDTPDGTCIRDFIHVTDLAQAHYLALDYMLQHNCSDSFNLGNNVGYSILEVISTFEKLAQRTVNFQFTAKRQGDPARLIAANKKAQQVLQWQPSFSNLETIIATAYEWEKNKRY